MNIESNIPIPDDGARGGKSKYPFGKMGVGDSVFIHGETSQGNAAMAARSFGRRNRMQFTARTENGGCRIWRVGFK